MSCVPFSTCVCEKFLKVVWFGLVAIFLCWLEINAIFLFSFLAVVLILSFSQSMKSKITKCFSWFLLQFPLFLYKIRTKKQNISTFATSLTSVLHHSLFVASGNPLGFWWCMHLHKLRNENKLKSCHNNIFNYQSHLRPLSCQEVRIRCRLNTDSVEKALSHDSMFPNALHATAWCQAKMFHANLTWSISNDCMTLHEWCQQDGRGWAAAQTSNAYAIQMNTFKFLSFKARHFFYTFWLLWLFSFCTFPLSCYLAASFHEEHLQRFSWRLERSQTLTWVMWKGHQLH